VVDQLFFGERRRTDPVGHRWLATFWCSVLCVGLRTRRRSAGPRRLALVQLSVLVIATILAAFDIALATLWHQASAQCCCLNRY